MIRLTCRRCKGAGTVPNPVYEACRTLQSTEARKHFYYDFDSVPDDVNDLPDGCTLQEKTMPCPQCMGHGTVEFDEEEWELRVLPDEEGEEG